MHARQAPLTDKKEDVMRRALKEKRPFSIGIRRAAPMLLMATLVICFVIACGSDEPVTGAGPPKIEDNLSFVRPDETSVTMGANYAICCGAWDPGYDDTFVLKIFCYGESAEESFWKLFVVVDEVELDSLYTFPTDEDNPVKVFMVDAPNSNELCSDTEESSGTITFTSFDCGPPVKVDFTVDCTVGSEYWDAPSIEMSGDFSCTVYSNPSPFGCDFSM
jgi:hypothetical protein